MFWCHNRSLLNVYDVETVIITHQQSVSRWQCASQWHETYGWQWKICDAMTMTMRYHRTRFDSILFYSISYHSVLFFSVRWTISSLGVEEYIFLLCSFFSLFVVVDDVAVVVLYLLFGTLGLVKRRELRVQIHLTHSTHEAFEHETEQPYLFITYIMLENKI